MVLLQAINGLLITNILGKLKSNRSRLKYLKWLGQEGIRGLTPSLVLLWPCAAMIPSTHHNPTRPKLTTSNSSHAGRCGFHGGIPTSQKHGSHEPNSLPLSLFLLLLPSWDPPYKYSYKIACYPAYIFLNTWETVIWEPLRPGLCGRGVPGWRAGEPIT